MGGCFGQGTTAVLVLNQKLFRGWGEGVVLVCAFFTLVKPLFLPNNIISALSVRADHSNYHRDIRIQTWIIIIGRWC